MKLNRNFISRISDDESILVSGGGAEFSGIVKGNRTFGVILELLKKETSEADLISAMKGRFEAPEGMIEKDVARVLSELRRIGALDE
ncbi:MAG: PqqD family protein [Solobacterium sp.]|nr:PqqD family protein [Solobacterium sp.]